MPKLGREIAVKVRVGLGVGSVHETELDGLLEQLDGLRVDSLWLSELVSSSALDPIVGLAYAAARTTHLKLGTGVSVLPGRNPVLFAKQFASLARLAPGRILPAVGVGPARSAERGAFPLPAGSGAAAGSRGRRGDVFDEALTLVRRLLREPEVTFHGEFFTLDGIGIGELPPKPLDIWLGGAAPAALRRVGRLGDGWLASFVTPAEAAASIATIARAAEDAGRQVDPEHFGVSVAVVVDGPPPASLAATVRERRPGTDPAELVPVGWDGLRRLIGAYIDAGVSKFVVRPAMPPPSWSGFADRFAAEVKPLET
jgi:probable F420-dependent oxidoreductase